MSRWLLRSLRKGKEILQVRDGQCRKPPVMVPLSLMPSPQSHAPTNPTNQRHPTPRNPYHFISSP